MKTILSFASMVAALMAGTSAPAAVEFWSGSELKSAASAVTGESDEKGIAGKTLGAASLFRRSKSGQAELHRTKTDLLVIQEGAATLVYGGTIPDGHATQPNEVRGSSIKGGESKKVSPGDIVRIPVNTPHQFVLEKGQSVAYFALKLTR